jgi:hypothetical protein
MNVELLADRVRAELDEAPGMGADPSRAVAPLYRFGR